MSIKLGLPIAFTDILTAGWAGRADPELSDDWTGGPMGTAHS